MDARERTRSLIVRGDNRLKQSDDPRARTKAREAYEEALALAVENGFETQIRPLVEARLRDLDARAD